MTNEEVLKIKKEIDELTENKMLLDVFEHKLDISNEFAAPFWKLPNEERKDWACKNCNITAEQYDKMMNFSHKECVFDYDGKISELKELIKDFIK